MNHPREKIRSKKSQLIVKEVILPKKKDPGRSRNLFKIAIEDLKKNPKTPEDFTKPNKQVLEPVGSSLVLEKKPLKDDYNESDIKKPRSRRRKDQNTKKMKKLIDFEDGIIMPVKEEPVEETQKSDLLKIIKREEMLMKVKEEANQLRLEQRDMSYIKEQENLVKCWMEIFNIKKELKERNNQRKNFCHNNERRVSFRNAEVLSFEKRLQEHKHTKAEAEPCQSGVEFLSKELSQTLVFPEEE